MSMSENRYCIKYRGLKALLISQQQRRLRVVYATLSGLSLYTILLILTSVFGARPYSRAILLIVRCQFTSVHSSPHVHNVYHFFFCLSCSALILLLIRDLELICGWRTPEWIPCLLFLFATQQTPWFFFVWRAQVSNIVHRVFSSRGRVAVAT